MSRKAITQAPRRHHLDKRAGALIEAAPGADADELLSTSQVADWIGYSTQWLEIGRHRGYGPKFIRVGPKRIRYRRGDVIAFLNERVHQCTSEYRRELGTA